MNFHSDEWVMKQIDKHYEFACDLYNEKNLVGLFCQGSTNYGLDIETSDIDTKCIVVPSFKDIALMRKPVSTTNILPNNEHCDGKDIRLYMETFRKQNLNFLEILFTPYFVINDLYFIEWMRLVEAREEIAHMNPYRAVKSMQGIAKEKYHAMEHRYPAKAEIIDKYGYDGKQVHHLLRVEDYLERYITGEPYKDCLKPTPSRVPHMMDYKKLDVIPLEVARVEAKESLDRIDAMAAKFFEGKKDEEDAEVRALLDDVCYKIMKIAVEEELKIYEC